jgi:hypothetical protein
MKDGTKAWRRSMDLQARDKAARAFALRVGLPIDYKEIARRDKQDAVEYVHQHFHPKEFV